jgi:hypothetical protein
MAQKATYVSSDTNRGSIKPIISEGLDSVRAYQFEIQFLDMPSLVNQANPTDLTLAAKQVSQVGMTVEDIEVNRVNDKVFYPGKASPEELTVTFDNFYNKSISNALWQWFSSIYDPTTGKFHTEGQEGQPNTFKGRAIIVHLDSRGQPLYETRLTGVYPKSWKTAEFNYSTNEFHTIELGLRYDFMEHVGKDTGYGGALASTV